MQAGGWPLKTVEHLGEKRRRLRLATRRRHLCFLVFVLGVANTATRPLDLIVDHRHDGVIGNAALAWTIIVQHVAGPIPAFLHATPPKNPISRPPGPDRYLSTTARTVNRGPLLGPNNIS